YYFCVFFFFFFQAEDGIRDGHVTGVQTCALPILVDGNIFESNWKGGDQDGFALSLAPVDQNGGMPWATVQDITFTHNIVRHSTRSEERRVGKECRSGWWRET